YNGKTGTLVEMGEEIFYLNEILVTWHEAKRSCENEGMFLAEPEDVLGLREHCDVHYWIGGQGNGNEFIWDTSSETVYPNQPTMWQQQHPTDVTDSFCTDFRPETDPGPLASIEC
ncbi:unnamed protein product, partial [Meganyctiphanes norvegica]